MQPFGILLNVNFRTQAGEAVVDQEDKMGVSPWKEPEVEKKQKPEHEPALEFVEEKESKGRKQKALKKIEMGNAGYKPSIHYQELLTAI